MGEDKDKNGRKSIASQILKEGQFSGVFAGWGSSRVIAMKASKDGELSAIADTNADAFAEASGEAEKHHPHVGLTPLYSVSIAGCDLMGSCLYTAGICASSSGKLAPVCLLCVTAMLFVFRRVYSEVVTAIPVNGGTYNVMLNTATKKLAAFVACLSMLSYIATSILSAFDAIVYLSLLWPEVDIRAATIIVMAFFGVVCIGGVGESAVVSAGIFIMHMTVITVLIIWCFVYGCQDNFEIFKANTHTPYPDIVSSSGTLLAHNNGGSALFFGYCSALLGITGFETAANYVEEMRDPGVFVTTVDWLWVFVGFYNPIIMVVAMMVMPMDTIYENSGDMLAKMAEIVGGKAFNTVMCVDAFVVLCGAVITAIIGVVGLMKRLANDKVLPDFLSITNSRGSAHWSIICFTVLCLSLFLAIFNPKDPHDIGSFGGVYTISFLSVLVAFAIAAILLKLYRPKLARLVIAQWWQIILSLAAVALGLIGNIVLTPEVFNLFLIYLVGFVGVAAYMFTKVEIFSFGVWMLRKMNLSDEKTAEAKKGDLEILEACVKQAAYDEKTYFMSLANDAEMLQSQYIPVPSATSSEKKTSSTAANIMSSFKKLAHRASFSGDPTATSTHRASFTGSLHDGSAPHRGSFTAADHAHSEGSIPANHRTSLASTDSAMTPPPLHRGSITDSTTDFTSHELEPKAEHVMSWGEGIIINVRRRMSVSSVDHDHAADDSDDKKKAKRLVRSDSMMELDGIYVRPIMGRMLRYFMASLDNIVSQPFVYLAKNSDPIAVHLAVEYICANELSNNIYVVHFVDDRKAIRLHNTFRNRVYKEVRFGRMDKAEADRKSNSLLLQFFMDGTSSLSGGDGVHDASMFNIEAATKQLSTTAKRLVNTVAILDTFYTYKKIHCLIVRGAYFCPAAVECLSHHLGVKSNSMIMGVPDSKFPFPFARLKGVRLAVSTADAATVEQTAEHLRNLLGDAAFNSIMKTKDESPEVQALIDQGKEEAAGLEGTVAAAPEEPMFDISQLPDDSETAVNTPAGDAGDIEMAVTRSRVEHAPLDAAEGRAAARYGALVQGSDDEHSEDGGERKSNDATLAASEVHLEVAGSAVPDGYENDI